MSLPKLQIPTYELKLPSTGKKIKYRSFLVKEEKLLMIANETGENEEKKIAITQIIDNCTFSKLNTTDLPVFDLEYLFLNLRAKSVSEFVDINVLCPDDGKTYCSVKVNLLDIKCRKVAKNENVIKLDDSVGVILNYPTLDLITDSGDVIHILSKLIKSIYDKDNIHERIDFTDEEIIEFVESMTQEQLKKISDFYENIPSVEITIKVKNPETEVISDVTLKGLDSFF